MVMMDVSRSGFICDIFRFPGGDVLLTASESGVRPFIAVVTGHDATFKWARKFVGAWADARILRQWAMNPEILSRAVMRGSLPLIAYASLAALGPPPAALDIRWGPAAPIGPFRGYFVYRTPERPGDVALIRISEMELTGFMASRIEPITKPNRSHPRARISFDEEV